MEVRELYNVKSIKKFLSEVQYNIRQQFHQVHMECEVDQMKEYDWAVYVTFKDKTGTVNGMIYKRNYHTGLAVGDKLHVTGEIRVNRGQVTIVPTEYHIDGQGDEFNRMNQVIDKLKKKGYFDLDKKRPIGNTYQNIGLVTSIQAAGFKDMVDTFRKRMLYGRLYLYPTLVQGTMAPSQVSAAIRLANRDQRVEVLVIARGGGSKNDLSCFNDQTIADEIFKSKLPVVTGIGHQIDESIADMVADKSFITPTAVAEGITTDKQILVQSLEYFKKQAQSVMRHKFQKVLVDLNSTQMNINQYCQNIFPDYRKKILQLKQQLSRHMTKVYYRQRFEFQKAGVQISNFRPTDFDGLKIKLEHQKKHAYNSIVKQISEKSNCLGRYQVQCQSFFAGINDGRVSITYDNKIISDLNSLKQLILAKKPITISLSDGELLVNMSII